MEQERSQNEQIQDSMAATNGTFRAGSARNIQPRTSAGKKESKAKLRVELTDLRKENYFYEEAIKTLRTNIQFAGIDVKTILVTSSFPNEGKSDIVFQLAKEMGKEFDVEKRSELGIQMQQTVLDDNAYVFCSHLKMSMIMQSNVTGLVSHPCDYYELTADLDIN